VQVLELNSEINSNSLQPEYVGNNLQITQRPFYTEQNLNFTFSNLFSALNDIKTNNFSNLYLTNRRSLSSIFTLNSLESDLNQTFSTYLAFNYNNTPLYVSVDESNFQNTNTSSSITLTSTNIQNSNYFDIVFLSDSLCKIAHTYNNIIRYLTIDSSGNLYFADNVGISGISSPQIFYYFYDSINNYIVLYCKILDIPTFITYNNSIIATQPITTLSIQNFPDTSLISIRPVSQSINSFSITDYNAHYTPNFKNNILDVDDGLSDNDINKSFLINCEYSNIEKDTFDVNILTLKNSQTPENYTAYSDNYINNDYYNYRNYQKIYSGSNQEKGNDKISLGYDSYTSQVKLKAGSITYFHIPYNIYPYTQININDTNLAEKGAIAGSHPLQSDKIFKKKAGYLNSSNFGNASDENTGQFLCAWLSGSSDKLLRPIWVDRYYNPQILTPSQALSSQEPQIIFYNDSFSNLVNSLSTNVILFDKMSDVYLEPGTLFAYHHLGQIYVQNYVNLNNSKQIQNGLINFYENGSDIISTIKENEFNFQGNEYSISTSLSSIYNNNQFTLSFDLYNFNWSKDFANQIIGNYIQDGFGIFNQNAITPFIYFWNNKILYVYNTDLVLLKQIQYESNIKGIFRLENLLDYYIILQNNKIYRVSTDNAINYAATSVASLSNVLNTFNTPNSGFILTQQVPFSASILSYNFSNNIITDLTHSSLVHTLCSLPLSAMSTIDYYNNNLYLTNSSTTQRVSGSLFYIDNLYQIKRWDLNNNTIYPYFSAANQVYTFNVDKNNNFWIIYGDTLTNTSYNRVTNFTISLSNQPYTNLNIDFINELSNGNFDYNALVTSQLQILTSNQYNIKTQKISLSGDIKNTSYISNINSSLNNINPANGSYLRREVDSVYTNSNLNIRARLRDTVVPSTNIDINLIYQSLSALGMGYHNFCIKFDGNVGLLGLYIDGVFVDQNLFEPNRYVLGNLTEDSFLIGTTPFYEGMILTQATNQPNNFNMGNVKLKNLRIYDSVLSDFDILMLGNYNRVVSDMVFDIPCGKRSYIDEIDCVFKFDVPGSKSQQYNLVIKNTGISDRNTQILIEQRLKNKLIQIAPGYTQLNIIKWT
jgi:hypothetical protein